MIIVKSYPQETVSDREKLGKMGGVDEKIRFHMALSGEPDRPFISGSGRDLKPAPLAETALSALSQFSCWQVFDNRQATRHHYFLESSDDD